MLFLRKYLVYGFAIALAIVALAGTTAFSQQVSEEPVVEREETEASEASEANAESETAETIEEIVVFAPKPGDRKRLDEDYEDPVRAQLLKDFYKMQEDQEEYEWRSTASRDDTSRVSWGYDPQDEYQMRNDLGMQDLPSHRVKPASVFKIEF